MGLVNDHAEHCVIRAEAERARARFRRPGRGAVRVQSASPRRRSRPT
jgi:DNA-3-methyladenine glycosylase I